MTSTTTRRAAIVGTGGIAAIHARALQSLGDRVELVGAVDIDADRARQFAADHHVPVTASSLPELLATTGVDLVHVCTPPSAHVEVATAAVRAGAVAVVEKPVATSLAELDEMRAVEETSPGSVAVVSQHRFGSGVVKLRSIIEDGSFGRPLVATCLTQWFRDEDYFRVPWRGSFQVEGGGPTMGHGIHQMDVLSSLLGPWAEVTAMATRGVRPTETEEVSVATVRFAGGALAAVVNSVISPRETSVIRIDLERASVEVHHLYGYGDDDFTVTAAPGFEDEVAEVWGRGPSGVRSGHAAQFAAVLDALDAGRPAPVPLQEARHTLELIAGVYRSAFTGETVRSGDIGPRDPFAARMDGDGAVWHSAFA